MESTAVFCKGEVVLQRAKETKAFLEQNVEYVERWKRAFFGVGHGVCG